MIEWIVSSATLLAVLIALRQVLKGRISLRLQYALWGLALLRLLIPVSFGSTAFSVANALPAETKTVSEPMTWGQAELRTESGSWEYALPAQRAEFEAQRTQARESGELASVAAHTHTLDVKQLLLGLWIAGMGAVGFCLLGSNLRFAAKLRRSRKLLTDGEALPVYLTEEADTPCLFGIFRPAIYVTPEAAEDPMRLRHVIEHELTHRRHGDPYWSLLRGLCLVLHWYDPLVWWAAFLSRRDGELACDESTIARLGEGERAAYGRTLIEMTCRKRPALLVTATTMTGGRRGIRERIRLIARKPKTAAAALSALLLIAAVAVGCTFTGAKPAETPEPTETPTSAPETAVPTAAPVPTPTEGPTAEAPESILFLPADSTDYETIAGEYAGAYVGQFIQADPVSPYKADDAMVNTRVMEVREDGEAFIFQAYIGFAPAEPERFEAVIDAANGNWVEQEKRFYVWRYFCLEKTDGGWSGVDLDVLNYYSEYTAVYGDYFASVPCPAADAAIREAVIAFNKDSHAEGEVSCESHIQVARESAPGSGGTTVETYYLMVLYQAYDWVDGAPKAVSGSYIPSVLTFEVSPEGEYTLLEYWIPRDGSLFWDDLRGRFPADVPDEDLNNQNPKYVERVRTSCDAQAWAYFNAAETTDAWFRETALPYAQGYAAASGRLLRPEGANVIRYADGLSAEVRVPCGPGSRFSVSVSFGKGENGEWRVLPENAVALYTEQWRTARVYLDLGEQKVPDAAADFALDTANLELDYLEQTCGYVFDEAKVTAVTLIDTGTAGLREGRNLYRLEWRFLPAAGEEIMLAGGMTMEDGYLTEWGSGGQPYLLMGWKESDGAISWERICVTNTDAIETEFGTPDMLEKYGNIYTAAAVELTAKARGQQSLLHPVGFSVISPASSPVMIGEDWAEAFAARFTGAPEDDPYYCRAMEVRDCELYAEALLSETKTFVYIMSFACDPANKAAFLGQLADGGYDGEHPDWLRFDWFVLLEADVNGGWTCIQAGTGGYGGWGYLNHGWEANDLLDRLSTEQVGGEDLLMLLPMIDWQGFDEYSRSAGYDIWNTLWNKLNEACVGEGRVYDPLHSLLWSDVYPDDQAYRDLYVSLGFLHSDGAYAEGLGEILKKQYAADPPSFVRCLQRLPEQQQKTIRTAAGSVETLSLNLTDFTLSRIGEAYTLRTTLSPAGAKAAVAWVSEDPEVATVDENGTVTAVGHGTTRVVASAGGVSAACTVRVSAMSAGAGAGSGGVSLSHTNVTIHSARSEAFTLSVNGAGEGAEIGYISGDPSVVSVSADGTVRAVGNGAAAITVTVTAGGQTQTLECVVRVVD